MTNLIARTAFTRHIKCLLRSHDYWENCCTATVSIFLVQAWQLWGYFNLLWLIMFLVVFVCLAVCWQHYSKSYDQIRMKFYGGAWGGKKNELLNFGGDPDHRTDSPNGNSAIIQQIMSRSRRNFQDSSTMIQKNWIKFGRVISKSWI